MLGPWKQQQIAGKKKKQNTPSFNAGLCPLSCRAQVPWEFPPYLRRNGVYHSVAVHLGG